MRPNVALGALGAPNATLGALGAPNATLGALDAPNATLGALDAPNATLGALDAPNATLGALDAPNATLGRSSRTPGLLRRAAPACRECQAVNGTLTDIESLNVPFTALARPSGRSADGHGEDVHRRRAHLGAVADVRQRHVLDRLAGLQRYRRVVQAHPLVQPAVAVVEVRDRREDVAAGGRVGPPVRETDRVGLGGAVGVRHRRGSARAAVVAGADQAEGVSGAGDRDC